MKNGRIVAAGLGLCGVIAIAALGWVIAVRSEQADAGERIMANTIHISHLREGQSRIEGKLDKLLDLAREGDHE